METMLLWWMIRIAGFSAIAYLLLITAYTVGWYRLKTTNLKPSVELPTVSVLVALRNEAENISCLLKGLSEQQYPDAKLSFILVDDHSEDNTYELLVERTKKASKHQFKVISANNTGKKSALQQALSHTNADLIIVTDADCLHGPFWVARMAAFFKENELAMVLAPVKIAPASSVFQQWQALEFLSLIGSTAGAAGIGLPAMANGANMAFDRSALLDAGGFLQHDNLASGDDVFLLLKLLQKHGAKKIQFLLAEESIVSTKPSPDWWSFLKQRMRWVSKSKAYQHPNIILPALIVLIFNAMLFILLAASIFYPYLLLVFVLFVVLKYLIDLPLLQAAAGFMKSHNLLRWAFPLQLVYPFYVLIASVAGLLFKSSWKGRK